MDDDNYHTREERPLMVFSFDRKKNREERLAFVRDYAAWVKRTPNAEWSRQQALLIDSYFLNARNIPLTSREYLERVTARARVAARPRDRF